MKKVQFFSFDHKLTTRLNGLFLCCSAHAEPVEALFLFRNPSILRQAQDERILGRAEKSGRNCDSRSSLLAGKSRFLFSIVAVLMAAAALAHHSVSNFNFEVDTTVSGTVKYFSFTNPHSFIDIEVKDDKGAVVLWKVFATSKVVLQRYGWSPSSVKPNDVITVTGHPDKNKSKEMYLTKIKFANGTEWLRSSVDN